MKDFRTCMKGLVSMAAPYNGRMAVSIGLGVLRIAASLFFVAVSKALIDNVTGVKSGSLGAEIALLISILLVQILVGLAENWWNGYNMVRTQNSLREKYFAHVLESRWDGKEQFLSGDAVNRLEEDVRVLSDLVCSRLPGIVITVLQLLAASVYLMTMAPGLVWVLIILMASAVVGSRLFFKKFRQLTAAIREGDSNVQQLMQESLQHRVLVLTLTGTQRVLEKLGGMQKELKDNTVRRLNYNATARGFMSLGFQAGHIAAFLWGIFGIRAGTVTYGMMTAFLQLVSQVQRPVAEIGRQIPAFIHALTSAERLMELDELPQEETGEALLIPGLPAISLKNVTYTYPGSAVSVLKDFSHDFAPGKMTVVCGPTGIGKSTLIRLILGLVRPDRGSVTVGGNTSGPATRCNFGYLPQGNSLLSGTIRDNLLLAAPSASETELKQALRAACADFVLELPDGLDTVCGEVGSGLSEGQCQRIAIARALLKSCSTLILDEATSALDPETEDRLLGNLHHEFAGRRTIIFISHREAVSRYADEKVVLS